MSTNIGNLAVQVTGSTTGLSQALKTGEKDLNHFANKVEKTAAKAHSSLGANAKAFGGGMFAGLKSLVFSPASMIAGAAGGLLGGFAIGDFVVDSIKLAASVEDTAVAFRTMTGDAAKGQKLFDDIKNAGDSMRISFMAAADVGKTLFAADVAENQIVPTMKLLGDLAMGDTSKLKTLAEAYSLVKDTGEVTGKTLKTLAGAGVFLSDELAKSVGVSKAELKSMLEEGKVDFRNLQEAMIAATSAGGKFFEGNANRAKTFSGQLARLADQWEEFKIKFGGILIEEFGLKDLFSKMTEALELGKDNMDGIRPIVRDIRDGLIDAAKAAGQIGGNLVISLGQAIDFLDRMGAKWDKFTRLPGIEASVGVSNWLVGAEGKGANEKAARDAVAAMDRIFNFSGRALRPADGAGFTAYATRGGMGITEDISKAIGVSAKTLNGLDLASRDLTTSMRKQIDAITASMSPLGEMRRQNQELVDIQNRVAGGGFKNNPDAFAAGIAANFRKIAGGAGFGQPAQVAGVALQHSAEALSKIAEFQVGAGKANIEAETKAAIDELVRIEKERLEEDRKITRALIEKGFVLVEKKLPN